MFVSYPSIIDNEEDDEQDRNERGKKSRDEAAVDGLAVATGGRALASNEVGVAFNDVRVVCMASEE